MEWFLLAGQKRFRRALVLAALFCSLAIMAPGSGFAANCGQSGAPAIQLLPTVGLGTLLDYFCDMGPIRTVDSNPVLTIVNKTNAALTIFLSGADGTRYDFKVSQGNEDSSSLKPGLYRCELLIPGHSPMRVERMVLDSGKGYRWEILRRE